MAGASPVTITFTLPRILPLTNTMLRTHWAKRKKERAALAWDVASGLARQVKPSQPLEKCRVTVERCSVGVPDDDGLTGSLKNLMDVLCPPSKRHPYGLGVIKDDGPAHCEQVIRAVKVRHRKDQKTVVTIEELP